MFVYVLLIVLLILTLLYTFKTNYSEYWKKRGVVYDNGKFNLGYLFEFLLTNKSPFEILSDLYNKYPDETAVGSAKLMTPTLLLRDPDNIQHVLSTDFNSFYHRGIEINEDIDVLADSVIFNNGIRWRLTRQKLTPIFTGSKLRNMFHIMNKSGQDFVEYLAKNKKKEDAFGTLSEYCSAAISAAVFGIATESTMESPLLRMARKVSEGSFILNLKFAISSLSNRLFKLLRLKLFTQFQQFFVGSIKEVLKVRREDGGNRHDFADLCISLQKNGTMKDPATGYEIEPTDEWVAAQAFFFFIAGVEPSATAMFFTLFELTRNPDILNEVHNEIDDIFHRNSGEVTHENVTTEFVLLDKVVDEALRMYPPIGVLTRKCVENTVLPVGNITVDKGTSIQIPTFAIHHDPKYYPDPEKFDPERFTAEAKSKRHSSTYMPFGEGNRMCIGTRFARLQMKTGLVHILRHFTVKAKYPIEKVEYARMPLQVRPKNIDFDFVERSM